MRANTWSEGGFCSVVEVGRVPQADLRNGRVQPDLVHPPLGVAGVRLSGVPQPVVEHDHGAGRPGELLLAGDVVVAVEARGAHPSQMAAGHEPRAALAGLHVVRVPEQLDVERQVGRIGDRVDVQWLHVASVRCDVVRPVVVEQRVRAHERLDDAGHLREPEVLTDRRRCRIALGERGPGVGRLHPGRRHPLRVQTAHLVDRPLVDVGRDDRVEPDDPVGDELGHLPGRQPTVGGWCLHAVFVLAIERVNKVRRHAAVCSRERMAGPGRVSPSGCRP